MFVAKQELRRSHRATTIESSTVKQHLTSAELLQYAYTADSGRCLYPCSYSWHRTLTGSSTLKRDVDYDSERMEMALSASAQDVSDPQMLLFARPPAVYASSQGTCLMLPILNFAMYSLNLSSRNKIAVIHTLGSRWPRIQIQRSRVVVHDLVTNVC